MPFLFHFRSKAFLLLVVPLLGACDQVQSALNPGGPQAEAVASVWWVMLWGSLFILALVMALALFALRAAPGKKQGRPGRWLILGGGVIFPTVTLTALLIYGFRIDYPLVNGDSEPMTVEVTGHQWWWEVRYPGNGDGADVVTANEIHIPVGRTVRFKVQSADVIHSLWVPRLAGKQDAIPGHENFLDLHADEPGAYRGQCAEFCGAQHAHMAFWVIAEPVEDFEAWLARQRQPAPPPIDEAARRGREHFFRIGCPECHTVRGTSARGDDAPDLTHVGSRRTIAAGTLPMTRDNLARWISENQRIKPGNLMEDFSYLDDQVVRDLAAYLDSLQ